MLLSENVGEARGTQKERKADSQKARSRKTEGTKQGTKTKDRTQDRTIIVAECAECETEEKQAETA